MEGNSALLHQPALRGMYPPHHHHQLRQHADHEGTRRTHPSSPSPSAEAFSVAISQMYLGRSVNLRHGLSRPINTEHLRSRPTSSTSSTNRRGPLRADHTLSTPRSASDREIEEITTRAEARRDNKHVNTTSTQQQRHHQHHNPQQQPHHHQQRALSAQLHPTYYTDLADDTVPGGGVLSDRQGEVPRPHSARRVYLIKRPHSAPVYGRVTPRDTPSRRVTPRDTPSGRVTPRDTHSGRVIPRDTPSGRGKAAEGEELQSGRVSVTGERPPCGRVTPRDTPSGRVTPRDTPSGRGKVAEGEELHSARVSVTCERPPSGRGKPDKEALQSGRVSVTRERPSNRRGRTTPTVLKEEQSVARDKECVVSSTESSSIAKPKGVHWNTSETRRESEQPVRGKHLSKEQPQPEQGVHTNKGAKKKNDLDSNKHDTASTVPFSKTNRGAEFHRELSPVRLVETDRETKLHLHSVKPKLERDRTTESIEDTELSVTSHELIADSKTEGRRTSASFVPKLARFNTQHSENSPTHSVEAAPGHRSVSRSSSYEGHSPSLEGRSQSRSVSRESHSPQRQQSPIRQGQLLSREGQPQGHPQGHPQGRGFSTPPPRPLSSSLVSLHRTPSNLRASRLAFGSVDSVLVGLDAETKPSPRKSKSKTSWIKSWFSPKKGRYVPGEEKVPRLEVPRTDRSLEVSRTDLSRTDPFPRADPSLEGSRTDRSLDASRTKFGSTSDIYQRRRSNPHSPGRSGSLETLPRQNDHFQQRSTDTQFSSHAQYHGEDSFQNSAGDFQTLPGVGNAHSGVGNVHRHRAEINVSDHGSLSDGSDELEPGLDVDVSVQPFPVNCVSMDTNPLQLATETPSDRHVNATSSGKDVTSQDSQSASSQGKMDTGTSSGKQMASLDAQSTSSDEQTSADNDRVFSFLSGNVLKGSGASTASDNPSNTNVKVKSKMTRHDMITIQGKGSSPLSSYDKSLMLNDSGFPEDLATTFQAKPVMVRERKVSPKDHGNLFSKASKIVQAQRVDETDEDNNLNNNDDDEEPELVVIREYVFATKKSVVDAGGAAAAAANGTPVAEMVIRKVPASSLKAEAPTPEQLAMGVAGPSATASFLPPGKEDDSGLDSPPSMQDSVKVSPFKPKRSFKAKASALSKPDEASTDLNDLPASPEELTTFKPTENDKGPVVHSEPTSPERIPSDSAQSDTGSEAGEAPPVPAKPTSSEEQTSSKPDKGSDSGKGPAVSSKPTSAERKPSDSAQSDTGSESGKGPAVPSKPTSSAERKPSDSAQSDTGSEPGKGPAVPSKPTKGKGPETPPRSGSLRGPPPPVTEKPGQPRPPVPGKPGPAVASKPSRGGENDQVAKAGGGQAVEEKPQKDSDHAAADQPDHAIEVNAKSKPVHPVTIRRGETEDKTDVTIRDNDVTLSFSRPDAFANAIYTSQDEMLPPDDVPGVDESSKQDLTKDEVPNSNEVDESIVSAVGSAAYSAPPKQPAGEDSSISEKQNDNIDWGDDVSPAGFEIPKSKEDTNKDKASVGKAGVTYKQTPTPSSADTTKLNNDKDKASVGKAGDTDKQTPTSSSAELNDDKDKASVGKAGTTDKQTPKPSSADTAKLNDNKDKTSVGKDDSQKPTSGSSPDTSPSSSPELTEKEDKEAEDQTDSSPRSSDVYAVPDKKHPSASSSPASSPAPPRAQTARPRVAPPPSPRPSKQPHGADGKPDQKEEEKTPVEEEVKMSSAPAVHAAKPSHGVKAETKPAVPAKIPLTKESPKKNESSVDKTDSEIEDDPDLPERLARARDSLNEEEYNSPWGTDFSSIEDDIRFRITSAFPSAAEEDEDNLPTSPTTPIKVSSPLLQHSPMFTVGDEPGDSSPEGSRKSPDEESSAGSSGAGNLAPGKLGVGGIPAEFLLAASAAGDPDDDDDDNIYTEPKQSSSAVSLTALAPDTPSASPRLRAPNSPRKLSDRERPALPLPPPPPVAKTSREESKEGNDEGEGKQSPQEKLPEGAEGEKSSPQQPKKFKDKFKNIFSHSSEDKDKKGGKGDHKKAEKEDAKTPSPRPHHKTGDDKSKPKTEEEKKEKEDKAKHKADQDKKDEKNKHKADNDKKDEKNKHKPEQDKKEEKSKHKPDQEKDGSKSKDDHKGLKLKKSDEGGKSDYKKLFFFRGKSHDKPQPPTEEDDKDKEKASSEKATKQEAKPAEKQVELEQTKPEQTENSEDKPAHDDQEDYSDVAGPGALAVPSLDVKLPLSPREAKRLIKAEKKNAAEKKRIQKEEAAEKKKVQKEDSKEKTGKPGKEEVKDEKKKHSKDEEKDEKKKHSKEEGKDDKKKHSKEEEKDEKKKHSKEDEKDEKKKHSKEEDKEEKKSIAKPHKEEGEKKYHASKLQKDESKDSKASKDSVESKDGAAPDTDESKTSDHKTPKKALNWFKKKLATKGDKKKPAKSKKYDINSAGTEDEDDHGDDHSEEGDVPPGIAVVSASDESHHSGTSSSSSSSSESENDVDDHDDAHHDQGKDDDDEDKTQKKKKKKKKLKMPFFGGGKKDKKKPADHDSDSDTSNEESKSKLFSWSLGRKKTGDLADQDDSLPESYKKKSADWTPAGDDEPGISGTYRMITRPDASVDGKKSTKDGKLSPKAASLTANKAPNSSRRPSEVPPVPPKLYSPDEGGLEDGQSSPDLNASIQAALANRASKRDSGYELAKPLLPDEDEDDAEAIWPTSKASVKSPARPKHKPEDYVNVAIADDTDGPGEFQVNEADEESIVPDVASKPVHKAFDALRKLLPESSAGSKPPKPAKKDSKTAGYISDSPSSSPKIAARRAKLSPQIQPKLQKSAEDVVQDPVLEDQIVPSKAEEDFVGRQLSFKPDRKSNSERDKETDTENAPSIAVRDSDNQTMPKPNETEDESPRSDSTPRSDGSAARTYLDEPGFLDAAKDSWNKNQPKKSVKPGDSPGNEAGSPDCKPTAPGHKDTPDKALYSDDDISLALGSPPQSKKNLDAARKADESAEDPGQRNKASPSKTPSSELLTDNVSGFPVNMEKLRGNPGYDGASQTAAGPVVSSPKVESFGADPSDATERIEAVVSPDVHGQPNVAAKPDGTRKPVVGPKVSAKPKVPNRDNAAQNIPGQQDVAAQPNQDSGEAEESTKKTNDSTVPVSDVVVSAKAPSLHAGVAAIGGNNTDSNKEVEKPEAGTEESSDKPSRKLKPAPPERKTEGLSKSDSKGKDDVKPSTAQKPEAALKPLTDKDSKESATKPTDSASAGKPDPYQKPEASTKPASQDEEHAKSAKPAAASKPQAPGKPGKITRADAVDDDDDDEDGVRLRAKAMVKSPEPKPRRSLLDSAPNSPQAARNVAKTPGSPSQEKDPETGVTKVKVPLPSVSSEDSTRDVTVTDPSTSSWGEDGDSHPNMGDFTLSLDPRSKPKRTSSEKDTSDEPDSTLLADSSDVSGFLDKPSNKKVVKPYATTIFKASGESDSAAADDEDSDNIYGNLLDTKSSLSGRSDSELTAVTLLGDRSTPVSASTPLSRSTPMSSEDASSTLTTSPDITVTSLSSIPSETSSSLLSPKLSSPMKPEPEIYEPIFFDEKDPRVRRKPTEAPPLTPEKAKKKQKEPAIEIDYDYDDDPDSTYDVPPARRDFFPLPKEETMPVMTVVENRRSSRLMLGNAKSFEPEDSIAPYATYHGPAGVPDSEYEDDENPYMNDDDEDLVNFLKKKRQQYLTPSMSEEDASGSKKDAQPQKGRKVSEESHIYASLEELDKKREELAAKHATASKQNSEESIPEEQPILKDAADSLKLAPGSQHKTEIGGQYSSPGASALEKGRSMMEPSSSEDESSSEFSSSESESSSSSEESSSSESDSELSPKPKLKKHKKKSTKKDAKASSTEDDIKNKADRPITAEEQEKDPYLKSPEYKRSVEEINKLFAALEKEEQEMERQSSGNAGPAKKPLGKMMSYEEQRVPFKLKPREEDCFTQVDLSSGAEDTPPAKDKGGFLKMKPKHKKTEEEKQKDKEEKQKDKEEKLRDKEEKRKEKEQRKKEREQRNKEREERKPKHKKTEEEKQKDKEEKQKDKEEKQEDKLRDKEEKRKEKEQRKKEREQRKKEREERKKEKEERKKAKDEEGKKEKEEKKKAKDEEGKKEKEEKKKAKDEEKKEKKDLKKNASMTDVTQTSGETTPTKQEAAPTKAEKSESTTSFFKLLSKHRGEKPDAPPKKDKAEKSVSDEADGKPKKPDAPPKKEKLAKRRSSQDTPAAKENKDDEKKRRASHHSFLPGLFSLHKHSDKDTHKDEVKVKAAEPEEGQPGGAEGGRDDSEDRLGIKEDSDLSYFQLDLPQLSLEKEILRHPTMYAHIVSTKPPQDNDNKEARDDATNAKQKGANKENKDDDKDKGNKEKSDKPNKEEEAKPKTLLSSSEDKTSLFQGDSPQSMFNVSHGGLPGARLNEGGAMLTQPKEVEVQIEAKDINNLLSAEPATAQQVKQVKLSPKAVRAPTAKPPPPPKKSGSVDSATESATDAPKAIPPPPPKKGSVDASLGSAPEVPKAIPPPPPKKGSVDSSSESATDAPKAESLDAASGSIPEEPKALPPPPPKKSSVNATLGSAPEVPKVIPPPPPKKSESLDAASGSIPEEPKALPPPPPKKSSVNATAVSVPEAPKAKPPPPPKKSGIVDSVPEAPKAIPPAPPKKSSVDATAGSVPEAPKAKPPPPPKKSGIVDAAPGPAVNVETSASVDTEAGPAVEMLVDAKKAGSLNSAAAPGMGAYSGNKQLEIGGLQKGEVKPEVSEPQLDVKTTGILESAAAAPVLNAIPGNKPKFGDLNKEEVKVDKAELEDAAKKTELESKDKKKLADQKDLTNVKSAHGDNTALNRAGPGEVSASVEMGGLHKSAFDVGSFMKPEGNLNAEGEVTTTENAERTYESAFPGNWPEQSIDRKVEKMAGPLSPTLTKSVFGSPKPAIRTTSLIQPYSSDPAEGEEEARSKPTPAPRDPSSMSPMVRAKMGKQASEESTASSPSTEGRRQSAPTDLNRPSKPPRGGPVVTKKNSLPAVISPHQMTSSVNLDYDYHIRQPYAERAIDVGDSDDDDDDDYDSDDDDREFDDVSGSPPLPPDRKYRRKPGKYNEYSNVIRVDSTRLKDARIKSLSRNNLPDSQEDPEAKKMKDVKMRNAVSMDGGLDAHSKKQKDKKNKEKKDKKKDKKPKESTEDWAKEKKPRKPFALKLRGLFGARKKDKLKDGGSLEVTEEGDDEGAEGDSNVYEVVEDGQDDTGHAKLKKEPSSGKSTWPKLRKTRKEKDASTLPPATTTPDPDPGPGPSHQPLDSVDSLPGCGDARPIGRLLQLYPDGTQLIELIRPPNGQIGVQLTQGNEEMLHGKFVSAFTSKSTEKLLAGLLNVGDRILKINDRSVDNCPLFEVHDIIDTLQRLKFLVRPAE